MTPEQANAVYDILIRHVGASEAMRDEFVWTHVNHRCDEFRFIGSLGFGGKFWRQRWQVTCYPEDLTPARTEMIRVTNAALDGCRAVFTALHKALEG